MNTKNLQRSTLQKLATKNKDPIIPLRLEYNKISKLLTGYVNKLSGIERVYPTHLPTQASYRWSTQNPPITNWPRECINTDCPREEHEWTDICWSVRDILSANDDEVLVVWDHDNIEGRIHDLIVNDIDALEAHREGYDLHTITCCNIFGMNYPSDLRDPHSSDVDSEWRAKYNWQGKDTRQRVLAKNFNHGSKYSKTWRFVYRMEGTESYGVTKKQLGSLARQYIDSKQLPWRRKLEIMKSLQYRKVARTLYGARRIFYDSSEETAREGFSHMISGTVSHYNNETLILLEEKYGENVRLLHNAHDGDKIALRKNVVNESTKDELLSIIERDIHYQGRSVTLTAGVKLYD